MDGKPPEHSGLADTDPAIADPTADTHAPPPRAVTTPERGGGGAQPATATADRGPRQVRSGDTLGRYELAEEIGEGGMATVFRARDTGLRREVAVKVLFPHLARRVEVVRRFHREARAAAGLEHANILRIYDVGGGEGDDPPYIVMELIRGRTLLEEIEQRGFLLAEVVSCVGALLADALAAAHAAGIIHRDIKPSNVLIAPGGRLLLADFGVARLETQDSLVTRTGALLGTPAYMSPEQASGDTATTKSDLYSLGATLYQLSTALLPYSGSPAKVMSLIATGALVAPVRRRAEVGPDLSRAIEQMMHADPVQRPVSAAAIAGDLRALAAAGGLGDATEELSEYFADPKAFLDDRTPRVVATIVAAGKRALAESRLPRAIALADRASALAPEDPAVKTLVEKVTEGGRASRRRKGVLLGMLGAVAIGGGAFAMTKLGGGEPSPDAAVIAQADSAIADAAIVDAAPVDALAMDAIDLDAAPTRLDARPRDAGKPIDSAIPDAIGASVVPDALTVPIDSPPDAPAADEATLVISNDTWCDISVDGTPKGRLQPGGKIIAHVPGGHHTVHCEQPGINAGWTRGFDVDAGKSLAVVGTLLTTVDVTITVDRLQIDNVSYPRGAVAKLKPGRHRAVVQGGAAGFFDVPRVACQLHEAGGTIVCDP